MSLAKELFHTSLYLAGLALSVESSLKKGQPDLLSPTAAKLPKTALKVAEVPFR